MIVCEADEFPEHAVTIHADQKGVSGAGSMTRAIFLHDPVDLDQ